MGPDNVLDLKIGKALLILPIALIASCPIMSILGMALDDMLIDSAEHHVHLPPDLRGALEVSSALLPWLIMFALFWWGPRPKQRRGKLALGATVVGWMLWIGACHLDLSYGCFSFPPPGEIYICNMTSGDITFVREGATPGFPEGSRLGGQLASHRGRVLSSRPPPGGSLRIEAVDMAAMRQSPTRQLIFCQEYTAEDLARMKGRVDIAAGAVNC
jgi:hypothetical protein